MKKIYDVLFFLTLIFLVTYIMIASGRISISDTDPVRPFSDDWTTESGDRIILGKISERHLFLQRSFRPILQVVSAFASNQGTAPSIFTWMTGRYIPMNPRLIIRV